jgi:NAD(P)H-nitrite reductase large subunit
MATLAKTQSDACRCLSVTEDEVRRVVRERGLASVREITRYTDAGDGCMACHPVLRALLKEELEFGALRENPFSSVPCRSFPTGSSEAQPL